MSAIICTCDRHGLLRSALDSLLRQTVSRTDYEIIVIDNSIDKQAALAFRDSIPTGYEIIYHYESTPGLSRARNIAVDKARADIVAFMDDDAVAYDDWLEKILATFDSSGGRAGVVGGKVLPEWEVDPPLWLLGKSHGSESSEYYNHKRPLIGNLSIVNWGDSVRPIKDGEWLAGVNIAFKKELVLQHGGFDTSLGRNSSSFSLLSNEESNLMRNIMSSGYESIYTPYAVVKHHIPRERISQSWLLKRVSWQVVSDMISHGQDYTQENDKCLENIKALFPKGEARNSILDLLFSETASPDVFEQQIHALVSILKLALFDPRPMGHRIDVTDAAPM